MKVVLTKNLTLAGVEYIAGAELELVQDQIDYLTAVGGCTVVTADTAKATNSNDATPTRRSFLTGK